jgi:uncharacterized protein (DUF362 family)
MSAQKHHGSLSRKDFLRLLCTLGGATAYSSFLAACSQIGIIPTDETTPTITQATPSPNSNEEPPLTTTQGEKEAAEAAPSPTDTPEIGAVLGTAKVAFVKTKDRMSGIHQAIDLLGSPKVNGKNVFIKPNFNSAHPAPGSTHPDVLRTIVSILRENGAETITMGDRSGMGNTRNVMEQIGVFQMAEELGFNTLVFDELGADDWVMIHPEESHWKEGFPFSRACLEAEVLIQVCCLKTHRFGGQFTMSLKNSVGMVAKRNLRDNHDYMNELHSSPHQRRMIAEINSAYTPNLIVLDGIEAFISGGPEDGARAPSEVILAGTDRIAIDAVGVALLRYHGCQTEVARGKIFQQDQLKRAVQLGLGIDKPDRIEFITGDSESAAYAELVHEVLLG